MESSEIANIVQQLCDSYELELYELHSTVNRVMDLLEREVSKGKTTVDILDVYKVLNEDI